MHTIIRPAVKEDLPVLLEFVRDLAIYEKEPEAVTATLKDYEEAFAEGIFQSQIAETDGTVAGIIIYYITWSTWKGKMLYLEDFIIKFLTTVFTCNMFLHKYCFFWKRISLNFCFTNFIIFTSSSVF